MKQRCYLWVVWLTWLALPAIALMLWLSEGWYAAAFVVVVGIVAQVAYLRWFPRLSRWIGYGSVADVAARVASPLEQQPRVTLYTANVCPFCPIVRRRLIELQRDLAFEFEEVDVTFRPHVVRAKGLRSIPVIEADGQVLVGNATSAQLAGLLRKAAEGLEH